MGTKTQHKRAAKLQWVKIGKTRTLEVAQRKFNKGWANTIAAELVLEELGNPTLCKNEDGTYNIIDGQHRIAALKIWLGDGYEDEQIQCWVYEGLTHREQADKFRKLNNSKTVGAFDRFMVGIEAGYELENNINDVLVKNGMKLALGTEENSISAVGTLAKIYKRSNGETLGQALRIINEAFGCVGFQASIIDGIAHLCQRYNDILDEDHAIERLSTVKGGLGNLQSRAAIIRRQTANDTGTCVAAAAVEIINRGKGGKNIQPWFTAMAG